MQPKSQGARSKRASSGHSLPATCRASQAVSKPNATALRLQNYSLKACHIPAESSHKTAKAATQE